MEPPNWLGQAGAVWQHCRKELGVLGTQELRGISTAPLPQGLKEDQPHTELDWQRHCQLLRDCDSFPHLWVDIQTTTSSFGPPEHGTFWQIVGTPRGFRVWSLWCAGRGWESSFCLDWEEKAQRGLTAVLHYLERDYRQDAWSHFSQVNKEQEVVDANCKPQLDEGKDVFQLCKQASTRVGCTEVMESPLWEIFGTQLHNALSNLIHVWSRHFD